MKLYYISSQFVEERQPAGMIQMLYTAREFQRALKDNFNLVVRGVSDKHIMDKWGLKCKVSGCPFRARIVFYIFWLPVFWAKQVGAKDKKVLYCLDWHAAIAGILYKKIFRYKIAIEYHDPPFGSWKDAVIVRFCDYLLPTTLAMKEYLTGINKIAEQKSGVIANAIDLEKFNRTPSQKECREKLGLPKDKKIVLYSGNFVARKGIYVLAEAARYLSKDVLVVMIGGHDPDSISEFKEKIGEVKNILVAGYKPHEEIALWIASSDVAVASNSAIEDTEQGAAAVKWTSPMKLFEYMAARRPIVVSDIPAVRELLDESMAIFVRPDDAVALAEGIEAALNSKEKALEMTEKAYERVKELTWEKRAELILRAISNLEF